MLIIAKNYEEALSKAIDENTKLAKIRGEKPLIESELIEEDYTFCVYVVCVDGYKYKYVIYERGYVDLQKNMNLYYEVQFLSENLLYLCSNVYGVSV